LRGVPVLVERARARASAPGVSGVPHGADLEAAAGGRRAAAAGRLRAVVGFTGAAAVSSCDVANSLLEDVLDSLALHVAGAGRLGRFAVVDAFGVRYGLSGRLSQGWLYPLPFDASLPVLYCGGGRLWKITHDAKPTESRQDLGDVYELVSYVIEAPKRARRKAVA